MIGGVLRYMNYGLEPGGFLSAVIRNNLADSFAAADESNTRQLREWVQWFYMYAPAISWGSEKRMNDWIEHRGLYFDGPLPADEVMKAQRRFCAHNGFELLMPDAPICASCGADFTQTREAQFGCDDSHLVGCGSCRRSWQRKPARADVIG